MVGAVIVSGDGRIIGEGYHVRCGEGHAEVNAFASIKPEDEHLLSQSYHLCESRTLLSLRQDAALCRFDSKKRSKAMRLWLRRSLCQGSRAAVSDKNKIQQGGDAGRWNRRCG